MPETPRKTLRDYVLEGGIKGRCFFDSISPYHMNIYHIYEIIDCKSDCSFRGPVIAIKYFNGTSLTRDLNSFLSNEEATPEEVEKARKEGEQSKKTSPEYRFGSKSLRTKVLRDA